MIVNIWNHLLGSILYCLVPLYGYAEIRARYHEATAPDFAALANYSFGVIACFALSTLYVWRIVRLILTDND